MTVSYCNDKCWTGLNHGDLHPGFSLWAKITGKTILTGRTEASLVKAIYGAGMETRVASPPACEHPDSSELWQRDWPSTAAMTCGASRVSWLALSRASISTSSEWH